jgi:DNA-directed RNA polymerase subunit K/omega
MWPKNRLTRFEVARIIGTRALQIELGAPSFAQGKNSIEKAKEEFKRKLIPLTILRKMPDGSYLEVDLEEAIDNWLKEHGGI